MEKGEMMDHDMIQCLSWELASLIRSSPLLAHPHRGLSGANGGRVS